MAARARLARAVESAALEVPGVARLTAGGVPPATTLVPGGAVNGVVLGPDQVEVHFVALPVALPPIIAAVEEAVSGVLAEAGDERTAFVRVEDLDLRDADDSDPSPTSPLGVSDPGTDRPDDWDELERLVEERRRAERAHAEKAILDSELAGAQRAGSRAGRVVPEWRM